jgi:hypothetical protein
METKTKTARKKRKVSKHVLKAMEGKQETLEAAQANQQVVEALGMPTPEKKTPKRKGKKNRHVKDPVEATTYLTEWQNKKNGKGTWKFNKNTQSWIIRHLYEVDKVPKGAFTILIEYLCGLEGTTTRSRIRAEASRRALRYKEHEKKTAAETKEKDTEGTESNEKIENEADPKISVQEQMEEETRWQKLDEHEKRKEYKRARKILETIKE